MQRHIPVVVAGTTLLHPFSVAGHTVVECADADVVATCERVAAAPLVPHGRVGTEALRSFCELHGVDVVDVATSVVRERDRIVVSAHAPHLPSQLHGMAAVRVLAA